ncbi:MAG: hypothetical protein Q9157_004810 [Trypethelium eluteriae]
MNGYSGTVSPPGALFVRALYDYETDDHTSLSFQRGDVIQVITQLESGWWDGVIRGIRGWFPSNYCQVISGPTENGVEEQAGQDINGEEQDEYTDQDYTDTGLNGISRDTSFTSLEGTSGNDQEEAAYWIPQATPDGRLFYFNTLTGVSTMELPLENPTSLNETGPRDRTNVQIPEHTRPPLERMAGGYERDEETDYDMSASEAEGKPFSKGYKRRSYLSDGVSPATSMDSMSAASPLTRSRAELNETSFSVAQQSMPLNGTTMTSFTTGSLGTPVNAYIPRKFYDEIHTVPLTWNRMVEDMRRSVERYRQAINNGDRSEFVRRAEDISDHLRLLLAAGSGTTDNHSGNPSIISTNKALYPHFREMMSRFSKLVLSSHIASADWPAPDSYSKCLQEADGVLNGVYGYVEVARQQRGEEIPRLTPGFVAGSYTGGSWQSNGLSSSESMTSSFIEQDEYDGSSEPTSDLDSRLLDRLEELRRMISSSIRRLDEQLVLRDKIVNAHRHQILSDNICKAGGKVLEFYRPWISTVESMNLASLRSCQQQTTVIDFNFQKQKIYDLISELVIACQAVASPLSDEWAEIRGESLEDRMNTVRAVGKDLDTVTGQLVSTAKKLSDMIPQRQSTTITRDENRNTDGGATYDAHAKNMAKIQRPLLSEIGQSQSFSEGVEPPENYRNGDVSKVERFFGEVPGPIMPVREVEEQPSYLKLEHEGEIAYDMKTNPPQLRGGTLTGLVEQLTRHDRLDPSFNNTFLLTYRSFTTASEFFEMLVKRWSIQPPPGIANDDYRTWVDKKQKPIRFRVVNILKSWFDSYWMEGNDETSQELMLRVQAFAKDIVAGTSTPGASPLLATIEQRLRGQDVPHKRMVPTVNPAQAPQPILPKNRKKMKFLDIDPVEFARQLTIIESNLYGKIKPTECLNKTWQKKLAKDEPDPAVNLKALILQSNQLTNWVAQMILTQSDVKRRVVVIKHFVAVADKCRTLNNFSTLTSIISALGTAPIHRLNRTWNQVNQKTSTVLESLRKLMASTKNFADYRETLHKAGTPCIPFFGVYLTDLTFIEDGIPSVIKKTNLINFAKRAKTAEVIREIQDYQNVPYQLAPLPELQDYIITNMQSAGDVHEMYERSLAVEPREREDEKIARENLSAILVKDLFNVRACHNFFQENFHVGSTMRSQWSTLFTRVLVPIFLARLVDADCACGYAVNSTSAPPNAIFTELFETDFLHLKNLTSNGGWIPQAYNDSAAVARGPFGKSASLANVVANPILNKSEWAGPGANGGDPGLQLWVRAGVENGVIGMGEVTTQRRDIVFGSIRVGIKMSNITGTCGAFFWYFNNTQEIDVEYLSREFQPNNNSVNLVIQSPASQAAGFNAAGTPGFTVMPLPFAPDDAFHEYRFDWLPDRVSFYADGSWLTDMNVSVPDSPGSLFLNHWSNGDPTWSGGPPASDAVMTVSYVNAYFNTSNVTRNHQYAEACASGAASQICVIPDQQPALNPEGSNGNNTGSTFFFTQQPNSTTNQTLYPGGLVGEARRSVESSVSALLSTLLLVFATIVLL